MFYINGVYTQQEQAKISVLDLGLVRGYGVFDYLRTYQGRPFHLQDHLLRLRYSAEEIGLELSHTLPEIQEIVETLLKETSYPESSIKIIATGGISPDQLLPQERPSLIVSVYPFSFFPTDFFVSGINATTTNLGRSVPKSKTIQYIPAIIALQKGRKKNAQRGSFSKRERGDP